MTEPQVPSSLHDVEESELEAIIELMYLAVIADGDFSDDERTQFLQSLERLTGRRFTFATLGHLVSRIGSDLEAQGRARRLLSVKERLPHAEVRKVALQLAIHLTAADGIIRTSERELIVEAAEALEIDRDEAADMVSHLTY